MPLGNATQGVIQPQFANRFRIRPAHNMKTLFMFRGDVMSNVMSIQVDIKNKSFVIQCRQPVIPDFLYEIQDIIDYNNISWCLDFMDSGNGINAGMQFQGCELKSATFACDYADNGFIIHTLTYKYSGFIILTNDTTLPNDTPSDG